MLERKDSRSYSVREDQLDQLIMSCRGKAIKILLIGETGVGRSYLTNALIFEQLAVEGKDVDPKTAEAGFTELLTYRKF